MRNLLRYVTSYLWITIQ